MKAESFHDLDKNEILSAITNTYKNAPEDDDSKLKDWGQLLESEEKVATQMGITKLEIETAKLEGVEPENRRVHLAVLEESVQDSISINEIPEISLEDLEKLKTRFNL